MQVKQLEFNFQAKPWVRYDGGDKIEGTYRQGELSIDYHSLIAIFGIHVDGDFKTDAEWHIRTQSNEIITIYNWKDGINYCGEDGLPVEAIQRWMVGGHSKNAVVELDRILEKTPAMYCFHD